MIAPATGVMWRTVRVESLQGWKVRVLPAAQTRLMLGAERPLRVLLGAVDRFGTESSLVELR